MECVDRAGTSRLDTTVLELETVASHVPVKAENKDSDSASLYGMMLRSELLGCSGSMPASPEKVQHGSSTGYQGNDGVNGTGVRQGAIEVPNVELHRAAEANMHYGLLESPMTHLGGAEGFGAGGTGRRSGGGNGDSAMPGSSPRSAGGGGYASISAPKSPGSTTPTRKTLFRYVTDSSDAYGSVCKSAFQQRSIAFGGSNNDDSSFSFDSGFSPHGRMPRRINRTPFKVLDAPQLADDFYLNLVDWSSTNTLAVGLGSCVYLWSACTSKVTRLVDLGEDMAVCSVSWSQRGHYLSVGVDNGDVQIWDAVKCRKLRTMQGHRQRVGCINWSHHVMATGSRDRNILMRDVRTPSHFYAKLSSHRSEVCGLKWSPDDRELASGGNDNLLMVWQPGQASSTDPVQRFVGHQAAVTAIAWSPHQHGLIASGGGTADRCIKFWNTSTGAALQSVDTGSQVCNLAWSKNVNEIVSTHGTSKRRTPIFRSLLSSLCSTPTDRVFAPFTTSLQGTHRIRLWSGGRFCIISRHPRACSLPNSLASTTHDARLLQVPKHAKACHIDRTHAQGSLPGVLTRWPDHRDRGRGRDPPLLERVPGAKGPKWWRGWRRLHDANSDPMIVDTYVTLFNDTIEQYVYIILPKPSPPTVAIRQERRQHIIGSPNHLQHVELSLV